MNNKPETHYKTHEIKKGWNHDDTATVRKLKLDEVTEETLQGIFKFYGRIYLYEGSNRGFPEALKPQLGRVVTRKEVQSSIITLVNKKYVVVSKTEKQGNRSTIHFEVNKSQIEKDSRYNEDDLGEFALVNPIIKK